MLSLHTNLASLQTKANLFGTQKDLTTSLTRLGTGLRINSAMDDAAGLQIATRLDTQSRGMQVAMKNAQNGISMLQTGEGALDEVSNMLMRMKDLATEASNATASTDDIAAMQAEADALSKEVGNILTNTKFGGADLFGSKLNAKITFQIGASKDEKYEADFTGDTKKVVDDLKGGAAITLDNAGIKTLEDHINNVAKARSTIGAVSNRLDHAYNNLSNMVTNTTAAKGRIMDADFATESANMTTKQMLMQSGTAMLKQSGSMSSLAMSLLG